MEKLYLFSGPEDQLMKLLDQELLKVEKRHIEWFSSRKAKNSINEPDCLKNHYFYYYDSQSREFQFGFSPDSELSENIKEECLLVFKTINNNYKK